MIIDFSEMNEMTMPGMNGGTGEMTCRMYNDEKYRIIPTTIHPGGSVGVHSQDSGDDLNYIISGTGKAVCDGVEEELSEHTCNRKCRFRRSESCLESERDSGRQEQDETGIEDRRDI